MVVPLSDALAWVQTVLARRGEPLPRVIQLLPHIEPAVHYVEVPSADAFDRWRAVREVTPQTGLWPVLLGEPRWVHLHAESAEHDAFKGPQTWSGVSAAQIIEDAERVSAGDWQVGRHAALPEPARPELNWAHGPWPEGILPRRTFERIGDNPVTALGLFPTVEGWQFPAYWRWWVVNAGLAPQDHCRVVRHWGERYGAELVMMKGQSVLQFRITRPPQDRRSAMTLAVEQMLYCPDQLGGGTLERLAAELFNAPVWYFWFD